MESSAVFFLNHFYHKIGTNEFRVINALALHGGTLDRESIVRILGVESLLMQNGSDLNVYALVIFSGVLALVVPLFLLPYQNGWLKE